MSENRKRGDGGFWDFVKEPGYRKWIEARLNQLPQPKWRPSSPRAIRSALRQVRDGTIRADRAVKRLSELGEVAVPFLVEALKDPGLDATSSPESSLSDSPLEVVLDLLEPFGPPDAVGPLLPRVASPDEKVRKLTALALGNIGTEACREPLEAAMNDEDEYVRSYAVMGLRRGINAGRASRLLLEGLFDPLIRLLAHPKGFNTTEEAASALLEIDRKRAVPILLSEKILGRGNSYLFMVMRALSENGVTIPNPRLRILLDELRPEAQSYPHKHSYGEALMALARSGDPEAEEIIREAMDWENQDVSESAAKALNHLNGIEEPISFVWDRLSHLGFEALTEPQKHYLCVCLFDWEVCNGGLAQYFVNSYGENARESLGGLEAMGAAHAASILRRAMALFGPDGPATDRDARHEQLAGLGEDQDDTMQALTQEYFRSGDRVKFRLLTHVLAFNSHFKDDRVAD